MDYNLKFKRKGDVGFWNTYISADTDKEAIELARKKVEEEPDIEYAELEKCNIKYRPIKVIKK